ncbi:MAG: peptidylprolyl isomerase [Candidatus Cloacimonetes bacterium]|jgi:peptidyl-prolyl cis-trans isomerase SurA|nr:peptidylprolyl isomerase [Candidatus Cloacimonadota bacterium]MDD2505801.1 peptidylprolyl isomerase [Candidatus Cloacimonadota bacterium]MDD4147618.1 peptidylprolyl isomerase [Candidatus Cloacimonadota bacterium]MDD4559223.1 peptidylprolyl isomerase [Candidatus Cloacimonadota bacterium]
MKKALWIAVLLCLSLNVGAELVDKIVARVGSEIILLSELERQIAQMRTADIAEDLLAPAEVLQHMVDQRIMVQKARQMDIKVDTDAIKKHAERYVQQIRSQYPSEAAFQADLAKMKFTQRDLEQFFADQITENVMSEQLMEQHIAKKVMVSDAEMLEYYEATKDSMAVKPVSWNLRMILREVKASDETTTAALAEINSLKAQLEGGADFAELASTQSDCPSSVQGGDLGYFKRGMMVKPFEDAAFSMSIGEISPVVQSQFGYHIIKVTDIRGEEIRASHILKTLEAGEADEEREMTLMQNIRERILAGDSFADLAAQYSTDPASANDGGIIGEFAEEEFPELFAAPIMSTPVGIPTEVLKNEGLIYIFMRDSEIPSRVYSFEEVKDQLKGFLIKTKTMEAYEEWIEEAKKESFIEISL